MPEGEPSAKRIKVEGKGMPAWKATAERRAAGPIAPGSKPIPEGRPNCLAGLTLVFTGELSSLGRDDAVDLAKRYGAKVTTAPSSKTSYVVVGEGAGAKKLETIKKNRLKTLDEDGFLQLIADRGAQKLDERVKEKLAADEKKVQAAAQALETSSAPGQLWTSKYAPRQLKELVGNKANVEKLQAWLRDWPKSLKTHFKKPGPNATNTFRAMLISGTPGIGKTTAVHLACKLEGYEVLELNASDTRSKKLLESELSQTIHNRSIGHWATPGEAKLGRLAIVLDEVDGMSGGDRGGIGAINALIRKTQVPIICICNDRRNPKMQPLYSTTFNMTFSKPTVQAIRSRMLSIAFREGLQIPAEVMDQLIAAAQSDLRLVTNMLSTWKLSQTRMSFDESKTFGAANQKPTLQTPFSLYGELASPQRFGPLNKQTLNDKLDYYFQDHAFVPLMVAENYLKSQPVLAQRESVPALKDWKQLQLLRNASESISDGDLVDTLMHGPQQHWSLMPLHGIASSNSKRLRLQRQLVDLQTRLRLSTTGSKDDVRQSYVPGLLSLLVDPIVRDGQAAISGVIDNMDEYYLIPEDRDTLIELELGEERREDRLKKLPTAVKTAFTRAYNARSHPMAFVKSAAPVVKGRAIKAEVPDNEEAYEVGGPNITDTQVDEEPADDIDEEADRSAELDPAKDALLRPAKRSKTPSAGARSRASK
ncbi:DNA replication factor C complex subunit Rfc1 [Malassezia nana]|uniref:Replication factor C subunit 1 n=1 Tax=Malassezia nana TaxID=180528 RepID=A0AAF0END8_9BASI|nr:DNA replication factor C complex subunit Rfc1 [Malassezia nana]